MNIIILPHLVASILGLSFHPVLRILLIVWILTIILLFITYTVMPLQIIGTLVSIMQIVTIIASILTIIIKIDCAPGKAIKKAILMFIPTSILFTFMLILDILISTLPIAALAAFDNTSLPIYIILLNSGAFIFTRKILSSPPLLNNGEITNGCAEIYSLTTREQEIINHVVCGKSNKEIGEDLFISGKTVENHLYNIYQKMGVKNRVHLINVLHMREKTPE